MKNRKPHLKAMAFLLMISAFLALVLFGDRTHQNKPWNLPATDEDELGNDDHQKELDRWLVFQRQYPFDSIPPDGRLRAWHARPTSGFELQALGPIWHSIGPNPVTSAVPDNWGLTSGRIKAVAISPVDPQLILIGASEGGIWRSTNGGASFIPVSDQQVDLSVGSIAFFKSNPQIVYAAMGSDYLGTGVLKSTDAGQTWTRVSNNTLPSPGIIPKIAVDPTNPNRLYVAQYAEEGADGNLFSSGFYLSTDGGVNWIRTKTGLPKDLAIDQTNPQNLYLTLDRVDEAGSPPAGLYRSTNGGQTWSFIYAGPFDTHKFPTIRIALTNDKPPQIYALAKGVIGSTSDVRVAVSTDGGANWTERAAAGLMKDVWDYLAVDPNNANTLYIGTTDLYKSTDGGNSFTNMTNNYVPSGSSTKYQPEKSNSHPDEHGFAFSPADSKVIYIGTDGGLYKTTDGAVTFQSQNATLSLTELYTLTLHPTNGSITYAGTQDNGPIRRLGKTDQWKEYITGDAGNTVINPLDPSMVFSTYIYGTILRWKNDTTTFDKTVGSNSIFGEPDTNPRISFIAPFSGNGVDSTLYFGTWRLFTSSDLGNSWSAPAGTLDLTKGVTSKGADVLTVIDVGKANPNVIYTGSAQGRAMVSTDGGQHWTDITNGLPDRFIKSISVDASNSAIAYLTVSGYRSGHVFKTTNNGANWTDISGNLPDIPTNVLLVDPGNPNTLYVGTDIGVFRSTTGGLNWESFSDGLPPVVVMALASRPGGPLQAATYGRGVYEYSDTSVPTGPSIDSVTYDGKKTVTIAGNNFGSNPRVIISDKDRSDFISSTSDTEIKLKGKAKKLGIKSGDIDVQVIDANGVASNVFTLHV